MAFLSPELVVKAFLSILSVIKHEVTRWAASAYMGKLNR